MNINKMKPTRPEPVLFLGSKDYRKEVEQLQFIDNLLAKNNFETTLIREMITNHGVKNPTEKTYLHYFQMFRINLLYGLQDLSLRKFVKYSSGVNFYRWFCFYNIDENMNFPSSSTVDRYLHFFYP